MVSYRALPAYTLLLTTRQDEANLAFVLRLVSPKLYTRIYTSYVTFSLIKMVDTYRILVAFDLLVWSHLTYQCIVEHPKNTGICPVSLSLKTIN